MIFIIFLIIIVFFGGVLWVDNPHLIYFLLLSFHTFLVLFLIFFPLYFFPVYSFFRSLFCIKNPSKLINQYSSKCLDYCIYMIKSIYIPLIDKRKRRDVFKYLRQKNIKFSAYKMYIGSIVGQK